MADQHLEPPKTVKEVGIHLVYMKEAIDTLTTTVSEQQKNYLTKEDAKNTYVTKEEYRILASKVTPLLWVSGIAATTMIGGVVTGATAFMLNGGFKN